MSRSYFYKGARLQACVTLTATPLENEDVDTEPCLELLAKRNEAPKPCNVAIILDCGGSAGRGGAALDANTCGLWCLKISGEISVESKMPLLVSHACGACGSNQQSQIDCCS